MKTEREQKQTETKLLASFRPKDRHKPRNKDSHTVGLNQSLRTQSRMIPTSAVLAAAAAVAFPLYRSPLFTDTAAFIPERGAILFIIRGGAPRLGAAAARRSRGGEPPPPTARARRPVPHWSRLPVSNLPPTTTTTTTPGRPKQ